MNENTQTLELQLKSSGEKCIEIIDKLVSSLTNLEKATSSASSEISKISKASDGIKKVGDATDKATTKLNKMSSAFKALLTFQGVKRLTVSAMSFLDEATSRAEELNLFNVIFRNINKNGEETFSDLGKSATRFQNKLNEAFGTNKSQTLRYQGLFQAMAVNQGIPDKYASIMSENMTKMTYDLASLYNRSEQTTAEALRGGVYAGQTKPLRNFGIDVTQTSLNPILSELGIHDRTVSQMSQAEKEILRYIAVLKQARSAMGDFAETIESPANQLKVFKQQLEEAKVALGNLFIGTYSQILPYANAFLMVIKEIAKAIAGILNIEVRDFNSGIASTEELYDGISDSAGNATKATKELKRQVLGFDQINNLTTPSKSGSGSGSGSYTGGIDKRLLDSIKGYDNLMDKVRMKATEIRDRWMDILGFKKVINPLTGEVSFKYQGLGTTLKNIWKAFTELNPQTRLFVGLLTASGIIKFINTIKKLATALGASGLFKAITNLFTPLKTMTGYTKVYWNLIGDAETGTRKLSSALSEGVDAWYRTSTGVDKLKAGLSGLVMGIGGMTLLKTSLEDIATSGLNLINVAEGLGGAFGTIAGAVQLGASLGGSTGAIIGGVAGSIAVLIESITGLEEILNTDGQRYKEFQKEINNGYEEWEKSIERINDAFDNTDSTFDYYERLYDELTQITDENGKIKKGYEDRAKVIVNELNNALGTEIKIVDGVIQKYDDLKTSIDKLIEKKKAMAKLNALEEEYQNAVKNESKARKDQVEAYNNLIEAEDKLRERIEKKLNCIDLTTQQYYEYYTGMKTVKDLVEETGADYYSLNEYLRKNESYVRNQIKNYKTASETYETATKTLDGYTSTIYTWEKMYSYSLNENYSAMNKYFDHERYLFGMSSKEREEYWKKVIKDNTTGITLLEKDRSKYTTEQYEALKKQYNDNIKLGEEYLNNLKLVNKTKSGEISKETIEAWKNMGNKSAEEFLYFFEQLPVDAKDEILNYFKNNKKSLSKEMQSAIDGIKPSMTIDVNAKTSNANNTINSWVTQVTNKVKNAISGMFSGGGSRAIGGVYNGYSWSNIPQYANGGLPTHGTLFTAGENGAEIVGNINRRTEVLNRSQIASSIYNAVLSAMNQVNLGASEINVHVHTDEGTVVDRINQKTKQTGRCPIDLPSY